MAAKFDASLPIDAALPALRAALADRNAAVLVAPPGAGKTTRVPLVLLEESWAKDKKILVLEPRRLAARASAARMAATLGEQVGDNVGLRVRFGSRVSKRTRIEVVTEGIFTRLVIDDPSLEGVAAVLFDEFHDRSLDADLGLAVLEQGWQIHYTNQRFGRGVLPDTFEAYKRQRHRWAYGGFQILRKHWRSLLPRTHSLTREQKREFALGWLNWLGAESIGVVVAILNLVWVPVVAK